MAVPLGSFYPFGPSYNDSTVGPTLDDGAALTLSQSFVFFGVSYDVIFVSDYIYLYNSNLQASLLMYMNIYCILKEHVT